MGKLSGLILAQQKQLELQADSLEVIRNILNGTHDVEAHEKAQQQKKEEKLYEMERSRIEEGELPDGFSLRRSPHYQKRVQQRQLGDPVVTCRNNFLREVIKHSEPHFDHRKTVPDPYASVL